jgi:methylated-DNA-[protein]-cysteine S-methyltransferase
MLCLYGSRQKTSCAGLFPDSNNLFGLNGHLHLCDKVPLSGFSDCYMKNKPSLSIHWRSLVPKDNRQVYHVQLPVAVLQVEFCDGVICRSEWLSIPLEQTRVGSLAMYFSGGEGVNDAQILRSDKALLDQLCQMLQIPETSCELSLLQQGTAFRQRVWLEISHIPFGETVSYKALAECLQSSPRAVANACRDNPFPGIIPCHRVIAVNGIGGFMGQAEGPFVDLKRKLLHYEHTLKTQYQSSIN